ncbi:DUF599 domain-containing protein [Fundidesulfovibrio agrisoli]|uniref:DUF599 domain-containing protein n=1 Tax=Fundidesulfovibrio agrisoli TaxID=2922717 RepID=UPI001FAC0387|nr:DUF599 domain-containing protein [Fundidesulfovibrio agrisoli]
MIEGLSPHVLDLLCLGLSILMFTCYNVFIWWKLKTDPIYTIQGATNLARRAWVVQIMEEKNDILAVQTLRNATMAGTFLASTAILLSVGVLSLTGQADNLGQTWHALNILGSTQKNTLALKLLVLLINLFIAFFSFSSSIRLYNHVGFMINVPCADGNYSTSLTFVAMQLNRAARHFHNGMLAFYYLVPLIFWIFGPLFLLGSTMLMICVVFFLDRTPKLYCDYITAYEQMSCKL